jgi:Fic family protein
MSYKDIISQIDSLQQRVNDYGVLSDEVKKKINYKLRLDWNYYSNRMEGGTLTREETRSVMVGNIDVKGKPLKDVLEMNGHNKVVLEVLKIGKGELRIAEKRIKEIHKAIMHEEDKEKQPLIGNWKITPNEIINYKDEKISFTLPSEVPDAMHQLLDKTNAELDAFFAQKESSHPLVIAAQFHIWYVTIHPFYDGNGRTARILTSLLLISCGLPPIVIKDKHKQAYYQLLADIQAYGGNEELFYAFIGERIAESQQLVLDAIEGKDIEEDDDIDKRIELLKIKLNDPDVVTESRSFQSTNLVLEKSIFPLLQTLEAKMLKLQDLFNGRNRTMDYMEQGGTRNLMDNNSNWDDIYNVWLSKRKVAFENVDPTGISSLRYNYQLKGYKKSLNLQYVSVDLDFSFYEFDFLVRLNNNQQHQKQFGYNQMIDAKSASEIVRSVMDKVLNQIGEASEKKD